MNSSVEAGDMVRVPIGPVPWSSKRDHMGIVIRTFESRGFSFDGEKSVPACDVLVNNEVRTFLVKWIDVCENEARRPS